MEYMERFMKMAEEVTKGGEAIISVISYRQSCTLGLYWINDKNITSGNETIVAHPDHLELIWGGFEAFDNGIYLFRFKDSSCTDKRHIKIFNTERLLKGSHFLAIYQEFGLLPTEKLYKQQLEESLRAESIKNTLVWACYTGDDEMIRLHLSNPRLPKSQLNKYMKLAGTPLTLCAKNDDIDSFKELVKKGADLDKKVAGEDSPLLTAFKYSYEIVMYIYENHREQFKKEVKDFSCLNVRSDIRLYQLLKDAGCDFLCEGRAYPLLHIYARNNNVYGVKFLLENGIDIGLKNRFDETALDVAEQEGSKEAAELLRSYNI